MAANRICQFVLQDGLPEQLTGRARVIADGIDELIETEYIRPSLEVRSGRLRLLTYALSAYLALC